MLQCHVWKNHALLQVEILKYQRATAVLHYLPKALQV